MNPSSIYSYNDQSEEKDKIGTTKGKTFLLNFAWKKAQRKGQFYRSKRRWQNINIYSELTRLT